MVLIGSLFFNLNLIPSPREIIEIMCGLAIKTSAFFREIYNLKARLLLQVPLKFIYLLVYRVFYLFIKSN